MHELSVTRSIVAIACEHAAGQRVTRLRLQIGQLSAILPDAVRFCFEVCAAGTPLDGAALEIDEIAGRARCQDCLAEFALAVPAGRCARCGGVHVALLQGTEMKITELEVEPCA